MESKLLHGNKSIVERTRDQEIALAQRNSELAEQRRREKAIRDRMEEETGNLANLQEEFSSLKQEVDVNTKRINKLQDKMQEIQQEMADTEDERRSERQEHESILESLMREIKMKSLILENFIPSTEKFKLDKRLYFDVDEEEWKLNSLIDDSSPRNDTHPQDLLNPPLVSALGGRRPVCQYARLTNQLQPFIRYQSENLLTLDLDMPSKTTHDYEPPKLAPQVAAALEAALQDEDDLEFDASPNFFTSKTAKPRRKTKD